MTARRTQTPRESVVGGFPTPAAPTSGTADAPAPHAVEHQAPAAPDAPAAVPAGGGSGGRALGGMRPGVLLGLVVLGLLAWSPLWLLLREMTKG